MQSDKGFFIQDWGVPRSGKGYFTVTLFLYQEMSNVNMNEPKLFLYQLGYLTIKKVVDCSYMLGYPTRKVRNAMLGMSLPNS